MEEIFISSAVASTTALLLGLLATGLLVFKSCKGASVQSILRYFLPNPTIQIETIRVHPVKACRGFEVDSWPISKFGVKYDREWMVYRMPEKKRGQEQAQGRHVFQLSAHHLSMVTATLDLDRVGDRDVLRALKLSAPGMDSISVPIDNDSDKKVGNIRMWYPGRDEATGIDQGDEVAAWLSKYINSKKKGKPKEYRLMRICGDDGTGRETEAKWTPKELMGKTPVAFTDEFPYLLTSQSSLDELNRRLKKRGRDPVPMDRFRPNIVLSSSNNEPFIEDRIREIAIFQGKGDDQKQVMNWWLTKPCVRCQVPTINQETGIMDKYHEPTMTLRTFRTGKDLGFEKEKWEEVYFGKYCCHDNFEGRDVFLSKGDVLRATFA